MIEKLNHLVLNLVIGLGIFTLFMFLSFIVSKVIKNKITRLDIEEDKYNNKKATFISNIVFILLLVISLAFTISFFNINVSIILSGVGFGLGYLIKDRLGNTISGAMLIGSNIIKIGDTIEFPRDNFFADINNINTKYTSLNDIEERKTILYNDYFTLYPIVTFSSEKIVRDEINLTLKYDTDLDEILPIIREKINQNKNIIEKDSTYVFIDSFGRSGYNIKAYYYLKPEKIDKFLYINCEINNGIIIALKDNKVDFSFPHKSTSTNKKLEAFIGQII